MTEVYINPNQHCTSEDCPYDLSHTAKWCGYPQTRQCDCHWDYPERGQVERAAAELDEDKQAWATVYDKNGEPVGQVLVKGIRPLPHPPVEIK